MKRMTKIALLLLGVAAGNSAQAQTTHQVSPGKLYTFTATAATGTGNITYQWYRDGQPIAGANEQNYILPDNLAYGKNVEFKRSAVSDACPMTTSYTSPFYVTFCDLFVGSVCWASANVGSPNTFAPRPDMVTQYYQWGINVAWPPCCGAVTAWNHNGDKTEYCQECTTSTLWPEWQNPCPSGWRLPTLPEYTNLEATGHTWADANTRGNAVFGMFIGPNYASCSLPNNMTSCIFLPGTYFRESGTGNIIIGNAGETYYWSAEMYTTANYALTFIIANNNGFITWHVDHKLNGFLLRCVQ